MGYDYEREGKRGRESTTAGGRVKSERYKGKRDHKVSTLVGGQNLHSYCRGVIEVL